MANELLQQLDLPEDAWYALNPSMSQPQRQNDEWARLLELAPCGLVLIDLHAVIEYLNPAAVRLLGFDTTPVTGKRLADILPAWKDTPLYASLPSLLDAQSTFEAMDFNVPGPDRRMLRVCAASVPEPSAGPNEPKARGVLLSIVERTDVATLERRLHRAEYQASIGKLARGIAHELNSPLDGVLRYTHLALEHLGEDSPVREYLVHVKEGLDRMVRAVRAFLEFSRQVTAPVNRVADLNKLIDDTLLLVQHRAKFQQVTVVKRYDPALPTVMDGGLQHAIVNLVKNAFDAMPRGGTLTLTTRRQGQSVDIEVEDTGSGIAEEVRPRIFEPFFSTKPIHHGNGLGLIIAKEVVERSGGTIEFASRAGEGTVFRIRVPAAGVEASAHGA